MKVLAIAVARVSAVGNDGGEVPIEPPMLRRERAPEARRACDARSGAVGARTRRGPGARRARLARLGARRRRRRWCGADLAVGRSVDRGPTHLPAARRERQERETRPSRNALRHRLDDSSRAPRCRVSVLTRFAVHPRRCTTHHTGRTTASQRATRGGERLRADCIHMTFAGLAARGPGQDLSPLPFRGQVR